MRIMAAWLESAIDNVQVGKANFKLFVLIGTVMIIGAFSLYVLLNSPA